MERGPRRHTLLYSARILYKYYFMYGVFKVGRNIFVTNARGKGGGGGDFSQWENFIFMKPLRGVYNIVSNFCKVSLI